jgi:hypothetical protein
MARVGRGAPGGRGRGPGAGLPLPLVLGTAGGPGSHRRGGRTRCCGDAGWRAPPQPGGGPRLGSGPRRAGEHGLDLRGAGNPAGGSCAPGATNRGPAPARRRLPRWPGEAPGRHPPTTARARGGDPPGAGVRAHPRPRRRARGPHRRRPRAVAPSPALLGRRAHHERGIPARGPGRVDPAARRIGRFRR